MNERIYNVLHVFAGAGGGGLGFKRARAGFRGLEARFECIGALDADARAVEDYGIVTGDSATVADLFTREDYQIFHGKAPPECWRELVPSDLIQIARGRRPDVVFGSPPCKGFSGLLSKQRAGSEKYQALNRLVTRWLFLVLEAWREDPPGLILLENVPRIEKRGGDLLNTVRGLLASYGYAVHEGTHDCGELGALGQSRRRYLLVARRVDRVPAILFEPPKRRLRAIEDVIQHLPLPGDPEGRSMHILPKLAFKTWLRLALIRAGKDWRDLEERWAPGRWWLTPAGPGRWALTESGQGVAVDLPPAGQWQSCVLGVRPWDGPSGTVTGQAAPTTGAFSVADPRLSGVRHNNVFRVQGYDHTSRTVTAGGLPTAGGLCVADPRLSCSPRNGTMGVQPWGVAGATVTAALDVQAGPGAVADPRPDPEACDRPVIISDDGCWHRPLTTLELAALQGFPIDRPGGLVLSGRSAGWWRTAIGNAVPPPAAQAVAEQMLRTLLVGEADAFVLSGDGGVWVDGQRQMALEVAR